MDRQTNGTDTENGKKDEARTPQKYDANIFRE